MNAFSNNGRRFFRPFLTHLAVLALFAGAAAAMTWPLILHPRHHLLAARYEYDAYTNTMILGTRVQNLLGHGAGGVYENYFFAPIPRSIIFNENLFGLSLLYLPFYLGTGNPLFAYNLTLLSSLVLAGYCMWLLVRRLTGSGEAGIVAGAAFAFCPYAFFEMGRIQLVATQWIPLCFFFLHRLFQRRGWLDALALAYAMQVGTCLYYALFLLAPLVLVSIWLMWRERGRLMALAPRLAMAAAVAISLALFMTRPYLETRKDFDLTRGEQMAQMYDGKLKDLTHVFTMNRTLKFLHHDPDIWKALEEIAFPGFTVLALAAFALIAPLFASYARSGPRAWLGVMAREAGVWLTACAIAAALTAGTKTLLAAALVVFFVALYCRKLGQGKLLPSPVAMYLYMTALIVALFLGLEPLRIGNQPVRGLYYYLYSYLPGFDGIRKISRQAVLIMFGLDVLAGFGLAELLSRLDRPWARLSSASGCAALVLLEFWNAPWALTREPPVPRVYTWLAAQPPGGPVAIVPDDDGMSLYKVHPGRALHNYQTLFHRHRTVNGKSSWNPPVTREFVREMRNFPAASGVALLEALGARYLVVHANDWPKYRLVALRNILDADRDRFALVYRRDDDLVYELRHSKPDNRGLLATPALPSRVARLKSRSLTATASFNQGDLYRIFDGKSETAWTMVRLQRAGDWIEFDLGGQYRVSALDFSDYQDVFEAPRAYLLAARRPDGSWQTLVQSNGYAFFRDQVFRPARFVFRIALRSPVLTRRLRLELTRSTAASTWSIHEAGIWVSVETSKVGPPRP